MPYDPSDPMPIRPHCTYPPNDPKALLILVELAALSLTTGPHSTFTPEELYAEAKQFSDEQFVFDREHFVAAVPRAECLKHKEGRYAMEWDAFE